jgi:hypothetical protein
MWIFTELGIDTGFPKDEIKAESKEAGGHFEWRVRGRRMVQPFPYVIKEPQMCADIDLRIKTLNLDVDHVYVLLRRPGPQAAALEFMKSRIHRIDPDDPDWWLQHEGLNVRDLDRVTEAIATRELQVVNLLAEMDVPHTLVSYPRFAADVDYAYSKVRFILERHNISKDRLQEAFDTCVNKDIIEAAYREMPEWYRATMRESWHFRPRYKIKRGF